MIEGTYEVAGGKLPQRGRYVNTVVRQGGLWRLVSVVTVPEMGRRSDSIADPATAVLTVFGV